MQSLCWPLCGEVISVPNLRKVCLRCILSPSSFEFFKISRSSKDEKQKDESGQEGGAEIGQVDGKW